MDADVIEAAGQRLPGKARIFVDLDCDGSTAIDGITGAKTKGQKTEGVVDLTGLYLVIVGVGKKLRSHTAVLLLAESAKRGPQRP